MEAVITDTSVVKDLFYQLLESDPDFFSLYGKTEEESLEIANTRAQAYLRDAMVNFRLKYHLSFKLRLADDNTFVEPITEDEAKILANLMFEAYLRTNYAKLQAKDRVYNGGKLTVHSPANERTSFLEMLKKVQSDNVLLCDSYSAKDRESREYKTLDYTQYGDTDSE